MGALEQKCNTGHGNATGGHKSLMESWLCGLLECIYSWAWKGNCKINDQPACELVMASLLYINTYILCLFVCNI